jgi:K(+)-stimulated pyrophosphate-energized sodium pump
MNILIKLMSIVSLVIAPSLSQIYSHEGTGHEMGSTIQTETTTNTSAVATGENQEYSAFLGALQTDGLFTTATTKISIVNDRIVIDGKTLDSTVSVKYIPLLNGATNIEMEFK